MAVKASGTVYHKTALPFFLKVAEYNSEILALEVQKEKKNPELPEDSCLVLFYY